jgi:NAD(P)-dependent dehydrogenase (short-subunit alcohol dehydrogenase family)
MVDEVALVTGGSKGIGFACAERLLADGYAVALCARNADEVSAAASRLGAPDRVLGLRADVGSVEDCAGLVPGVLERFGRVDVLVNNAGVYRPVPFLDQPLRRVGLAAEIAGAVSFLCGNDATYITGVTVNVDGGLTAMHPAV